MFYNAKDQSKHWKSSTLLPWPILQDRCLAKYKYRLNPKEGVYNWKVMQLMPEVPSWLIPPFLPQAALCYYSSLSSTPILVVLEGFSRDYLKTERWGCDKPIILPSISKSEMSLTFCCTTCSIQMSSILMHFQWDLSSFDLFYNSGFYIHIPCML